MFRRDMVGVANHGCLICANGNLAVVGPAFPGDLCGGQRLELTQHLLRSGFGKLHVGRNKPNARANIMLCLRQKVGGDQLGIARAVGDHKDL